MRTDLMVVAMCWDLADNVTVDYAHANQSFSYFCPHPCCLEEVRPKRLKNTYFYALNSHASGCPNEAMKPDNPGTTTNPAKKSSVVPPATTPTELGPAQKGGGKRTRPKDLRAQLLALAQALAGQPPRCAGTLMEVVHAWQRMSEHQRLNTPLRINDEQLTYETAFYCVSNPRDSRIEQLPGATRIIYGTVRIDDKPDCYWLTSIKTYKTSDERHLHLIVRVPKDGGATASYLAESLATAPATSKRFTLFYFGLEPRLSGKGKSYLLSSDITDDYKRFVVLPDY